MSNKSNDSIDLFVPGRLCLLGEHSDWAGTNRMMNSALIPGYAIVTGIEQGVYATACRSTKFIIESNLPCYGGDRYECEMDTEKLRKTAADGGFFSYVAGVASYINEHYKVEGLHIYVTRMDLPIKSGLSSSAAICVLVARAFNRLYHLHLNTLGEMNIAYMGEQRTPSRCGRLDQACAFGVNPVLMTFDGNDISVKPISIKSPLHYVVTDLNSYKDTVKILSDLNKAYPFASNDIEKSVQQALGEDNREYISQASKYMESGEIEALGRLMKDYQANFDRKIAPACPEYLNSPVLHSLLNDPDIYEYAYAGKGVGSQGDGTAQFLAKDEVAQQRLIDYIKNKYNMDSVPLSLYPQQKIKKAIIPVAGFATRLFPVSKCLKKAFFPIMDSDGILKPMIMILLEQLLDAGIDHVCLVIGEGEKEEYEKLFSPVSREHYDKLSDAGRAYENFLTNVSQKITYVVQTERKGFGHAVYLCKGFANGDPVLLLLGDMIYHSNREENCSAQMVSTYEKYGMPIISIHKVPKMDVVHYGILHGQWEDIDQTVLKLDEICEKPTIEYSEDHLAVNRKETKENYYAVFGQYVLTSAVFDALEEDIESNNTTLGEIQLTTALETVRRRTGMLGYAVDGRSYDIGLPDKYLETIKNY